MVSAPCLRAQGPQEGWTLWWQGADSHSGSQCEESVVTLGLVARVTLGARPQQPCPSKIETAVPRFRRTKLLV